MSKVSREMLAGAAFAVFAGLFASGAASAEEASTSAAPTQQAKADTSCFLSPAKLDQSEVDAFLANPSKLLADEPSGGLPLSNKVRALAGSSSNAAAKMVELSKSATDIQKAAIGAGLSRVVQACVNNPDYAANIQKLVAEMGDSTLIAAFMAASSDVQVAAVGGPGAGAAGNGVGGGSTADTSGQSSASNSAPTFGGNATTAQSAGSGFDVGDAGGSATEFISGVTR
jgi:putative Ca2+/H+ antiporter (TMEM165/GDT1 family)